MLIASWWDLESPLVSRKVQLKDDLPPVWVATLRAGVLSVDSTIIVGWSPECGQRHRGLGS